MARLPINDSGKVNPCFADEIPSQFDRELGRRQRVGQRGKALAQRHPHRRDVKRLVAVEVGDAEAAAHVEVRQRRADLFAQLGRQRQDIGLCLDDRRSVERLAAGKDVQSAPFGARGDHFARQHRNAFGIEPERLGAPAHLHA